MKEKEKNKIKEELDVKNINETLNLGTKIFRMTYVFLVIAGVYAITMLLKEWGVLNFLLVIFRILAPFFIGLIIAWMLEPIVSYLQNKKINRILAVAFVYIILLGLIYILFNTMIPLILSQINDFIQILPSIVKDVTQWFNNFFYFFKSTEFINFDVVREETISSIETVVTNLTTELPARFIEIVKGTFAAFGVFTLGLIIGFYLLFDFDNAGNIIFSIVPKKYRSDVRNLLIEVNDSLLVFVKGTLITSTIVFILSSLIFSLVGLNAPLLFGLICGITNIIPYIGPYLGAIPAIIVGFTQGIATGIIIIILLAITHTVEANFISPIVTRKNIKLHPVQILIGLLIFNYFFGILGLIIATPVIASLKIIIIFLKKKYNIYKQRNLK